MFMVAKHSPLHSMDHSFSRQPVFNVRVSVLWAFVEMTIYLNGISPIMYRESVLCIGAI